MHEIVQNLCFDVTTHSKAIVELSTNQAAKSKMIKRFAKKANIGLVIGAGTALLALKMYEQVSNKISDLQFEIEKLKSER